MGTQLGVEFEDVFEDKDIWVRYRVENETGIKWWRVEARAVAEELGCPVVVVVEVVMNDLCMELFQVVQIAYFQ